MSDFGLIKVRFSRFFQKPNKKPDSHEKHASSRNSRYDKLHTQNSSKKPAFYLNSLKTILTLYEIVHDFRQFSLFFLSLQALISVFFTSQSYTRSPESSDSGDLSFYTKLLRCTRGSAAVLLWMLSLGFGFQNFPPPTFLEPPLPPLLPELSLGLRRRSTVR